MKKLFWSTIFSAYFIFVPFFWMACSVGDDTQYVVVSGSQSQDEELNACLTQEFLTEDCVQVVAEENERLQAEQGAVTTANASLNDFADCQLYIASEEASEDEGACDTTVQAVLSGYEYCIALADDEKYYECSAIEDSVEALISDCDLAADSVSQDFCALLNPTVDA